MNNQQINAIETTAKLASFLEGALDKKIKGVINTRCIIGGLCMAIPL